ncbi:uncharacterized protein LOC144374494 [Ictidomys tridecemlineatus]
MMMTAPTPAVAVQMRTSKTLLLQSLKIMKKQPSATHQKKRTKLSSTTTARDKRSATRKAIKSPLDDLALEDLAEMSCLPPLNHLHAPVLSVKTLVPHKYLPITNWSPVRSSHFHSCSEKLGAFPPTQHWSPVICKILH